MTREENGVLMSMSQQLGRIESDIQNIKDDVSDLKSADSKQDVHLQEMYDKAMSYAAARQDSIRDSLQAQITVNTNDIAELKTVKERRLVKWWDRIVDILVGAFIIAGITVLLKWLQAPPEVIGGLK